ncbi:MAG: Hpt domain-containing protein, partial [Zoogloeaceae bacterium]|nr:Hpt domain-containing protein [Zoogloeaceae bacterium]
MALDLGRFMVRFVEEARDHIGRLNDGIARLETESSDREAINAIFRSAHTIKGSSRMLRLVPITETAHGLEDVLGALREGVLRFDPQLAQVLYRGVDAISALVDRLAETRDGTSLPPAQPDVCASLARAVAKVGQASDADGPREDDPPAKLVELSPTLPADPAAALDALRSANLPTHGLGAARSQDTVRVRLDKLDELINLMGELVSHHARLRQRCIDLKGLERELVAQAGVECGASLRGFAQRFRDDVQAQDVLMSTLHDKALVMRMLPLAIIFEPAGRMMRELARSVGKEVEFVIRGSEIELDRQVIDRLADPVVHLLRNALDHGLELPQERIALGKPAQGRLSLLARQDGDSVVIEVGDDGAGIPLEGVREKSVKRGMVSAEKAAALTEDELIELLFRPGFSTAAIITDLSGRGVGLDVVRQTVIDELSGEVSVKTVAGKGTSFTLSLPLSLAVVRVLLVEVGGRPFGFGAPH